MRLALRREVRVEMIDGEAIVLDRSGAVVHHVSGDGAEVLDLIRQGVDEAALPARLQPAVASLIDAGLVRGPDWSRRKLLKAAGASMTGAAIVTVALASPAAAASGTVTVQLVKSVNGSSDPTIGTICSVGGVGNSVRGTCVFRRTETPATISVTITLSTGTSAVGRDVYLLQSVPPSTCVGGTATRVGVWAASPPQGPQTFSAPIGNSATRFVVALQLSGGGGVDGWSSSPVLLA
jgi:hypothetical protein